MSTTTIIVSLPETESEIEEAAWRTFMRAHPHEAFDSWPDRFWTTFQQIAPGVSREEMLATLIETDHL